VCYTHGSFEQLKKSESIGYLCRHTTPALALHPSFMMMKRFSSTFYSTLTAILVRATKWVNGERNERVSEKVNCRKRASLEVNKEVVWHILDTPATD